MTRGWPRWRRRALLATLGVAAIALAWLGAPLALRRLALFRVRQVELVGVRRLAPDAVIQALRLEPAVSVFSDTRLLADRVRGLAGVAEARVQRHLPATLTVVVREVEPAALAPGPHGRRLVVVDASGRPLPFDPARAGLDLVLALIQSVEPTLFQSITGARGLPRGDVLLDVGSRQVVVRRDTGPEVIRAVTLVAQDLEARGRPYRELDARFAGQVVVRRHATAGGGGGA